MHMIRMANKCDCADYTKPCTGYTLVYNACV